MAQTQAICVNQRCFTIGTKAPQGGVRLESRNSASGATKGTQWASAPASADKAEVDEGRKCSGSLVAGSNSGLHGSLIGYFALVLRLDPEPAHNP